MKKRHGPITPEARPLTKQQVAVLDAAKLCQRDGKVCIADVATVARLRPAQARDVAGKLDHLGLWPYTLSPESLAPPELLAAANLKPEPPPRGSASIEEWRAWSERETERMARSQQPATSPSRPGAPFPWDISKPKGGDE